jgi:hypothetical protein
VGGEADPTTAATPTGSSSAKTRSADGRTFALVQAGLGGVGAFTCNRLKAAVKNAQGDR